MPKRKRSALASTSTQAVPDAVPLSLAVDGSPNGLSTDKQAEPAVIISNPDQNGLILDGPAARRASPDDSDSALSDISEAKLAKDSRPVRGKGTTKPKQNGRRLAVAQSGTLAADSADIDIATPETAPNEVEDDVQDVRAEASRPPPVHSDYLPLPWKGRLGYACLNTYLRYSNPPVFSSRTCRIASILEQRHPLRDPSMPHHATKNRPDRDQPADIARGQAYVEALGLANAKDIVKMLRWNDKYGIKFLRLSSEMFPFASHEIYGYKLAPFAADVLADAGKVAAELGHRLTTHPGQFSQLGSPRAEVIRASFRDLEYHAELLSLLKLPPQQNRDAVMILHMGGVFGDKEATLDRFRVNYAKLSQNVKDRLVLENDDVSWSVHELLPICEELNIPMVLDYHHHNIIHSDEVREGTLDIIPLYDRIRATWSRKRITQKMHYSEPCPDAVTGRQRRKHSPRVATLPPCDPTMDLMIEAKDKEQAVFELMRNFKLPGWNRFNDIIPNVRNDENKPEKPIRKKATPKKKTKAAALAEADEVATNHDDADLAQLSTMAHIPEEEVGMGDPDGRVYWPPGMEEWLRPLKRVPKNKEEPIPGESEVSKQTATPVRKTAVKQSTGDSLASPATKCTRAVPKGRSPKKKKASKIALTPSPTDDESAENLPSSPDGGSPPPARAARAATRKSGRAKKVDYAEDE